MENEKRLIDASELVRFCENEIDKYETGLNKHERDYVKAIRVVKKIARTFPTVDAVEVVRCKDCKHKTVTADGMVCECALPTKRMQDYYIYGSTILARVEPDAFCSYGERKDNERKAD